MKMLSVAVDESCANAIDRLVAASGLYSSRSEFMKDAIRKNLAETLRFSTDLKKIHAESENLALKARQRGFKGGLPSLKERERLARAFAKEKGI